MNEINYYDLGKSSKLDLERNKRLDSQKAAFLEKANRSLQESLQADAEKKENDALSGARFSYASRYARAKDRVNSLNEQIEYTNKSSLIGMAEMVSEVVESALLLDEAELTSIYPTYKEDIRETVKGLLEQGDLSDSITDPRTLTLMEYVANQLPEAKIGVTLTEDELAKMMEINKSFDAERAIRDLSGDISSRVAFLMEKEQEKVDEIEKDVARVSAKKDKKAEDKGTDEEKKDKKDTADDEKDSVDKYTAESIVKSLDDKKMSIEDVEKLLKDGEISQKLYDEVVDHYDPVELPEENENTDENVAAEAESVGIGVTSAPKKQIQFAPDGTMNVNIFESTLIRETPRCGLIESLAVNEARNMIHEGRSYNPDYCLSKALIYVTITEALSTMGFLEVGEKEYNSIINNAGGAVLTEDRKATMNYKSRSISNIPEQGKLTLNENVFMTQYTPKIGNEYTEESLAERIARKRMLQEEQNKTQILND